MTRQQLVDCSTATQTVFDAFWPLGMYPDDMDASNLAAALRVVADQVVPDQQEPASSPHMGNFISNVQWRQSRAIRTQLLAIADELEAIDEKDAFVVTAEFAR
jgi:hypothetical protein